MKHTQGKWKVHGNATAGFSIKTKDKYPIANILQQFGANMQPQSAKIFAPEAKANAKLIAECPVMYEFIAKLAEQDCEYTGSVGCDMLPQGVVRRVCLPCKARSIISKINA